MRKLLLALLLLLVAAPAALAQNVIQCNRYSIGATTSQIATAISNRAISICGFAMEATGATAAFTLSYGTGSNCGTGTTSVSPSIVAMGVGGTMVDRQTAAYATIPSSANLCVTTSTNASWIVYWGQF